VKGLRRTGLGVLSVVIALAGTVALITFFQSRDESQIGAEGGGAQAAPGVAAPEENDPRLEAGNVILTYRRAEDGAVLRALAEEFSGPPEEARALEEAGQSVVVLRRPNQTAGPVVGHALGRRLVTEAADDPQVRAFTEYWLGRKASE
jgi:hypothetical protein